MPYIPPETDLPPCKEAFHSRHDFPALESVYKNYILPAYAAATTEIQRLNLRVLGFLLIWPLNHASLSEVVRGVKRCFDNKSLTAPYERLNALGEFYVKYFILPFIAFAKPSSHAVCKDSPRSSMDEHTDEMYRTEEADARMQALIRDGFRCMISGRVDIGSCREFPQARRVLGNAHVEVTQNVRIMPVATKKELDDVEEDHAEASVWTVLKSFGYDVLSAVNEEDRLDNLLTLSGTVHTEFDSLRLWLEEVPGKENTYKVYRGEHISRMVPD